MLQYSYDVDVALRSATKARHMSRCSDSIAGLGMPSALHARLVGMAGAEWSETKADGIGEAAATALPATPCVVMAMPACHFASANFLHQKLPEKCLIHQVPDVRVARV